MKNLIIFLIFISGALQVSGQTVLDEKIEQLEKEIEKQKVDLYQSNRVINYKKLEKIGIDSSRFNFNNVEDQKSINLLLKAIQDKNGFFGGAVFMNVLGTSLVGIGVLSISAYKDSGGFLPLILGIGVNGASIPLHFTAKKKKQVFYDLKNSLINFKEF